MELNLHKKFVIGYSGIFGLAQGMEQLCDLMFMMKKYSDIHFLFIGDGPKKRYVLESQKTLQLTNLTVLDEIPRERIAYYISACDASLVPLKRNDLFKGALPSKLFDTMACERPVILSVDGEAREVLVKANAGVYVGPEDSQQMEAAITKLKDHPKLCQLMGKNGRKFVEQYYSREKLAKKLEQVLLNV